jgi:hypothetical protein
LDEVMEEVERETGSAGIGWKSERRDDSDGPVRSLPGRFPGRAEDDRAGVQTDGAEPTTTTGWARLLPDESTSTPVSRGIFGYNPDKMLVSESGIPTATPKTSARVFVDLSGGHNTAFALNNPG